MREILFRGKRISGDWVYGYLLKMFGELSIMCLDDENNIYPVNEETIGQYTGLTDKNGNKIFEGDILFWEDEFLYKNKSEVVWFGEKYNYPAFDLLKHDYESNGLQYAHDNCFIKVIGNIYDNYELLEGIR